MSDEGTRPTRLRWARPAVRVIMSILGTIGGAVVGLAILLAIIVAKARAGYYTFSLHDLVAIRWETLGVIVGAVYGGFLGYRHPRTLDRAALRGFGGMFIGIIVGALFGGLIWGGPEGQWAGGIIVGTIGLVWGALWAIRHRTREAHPLLAGAAGAVALSLFGLLGVIGVVGASDLAPVEFEPVADVDLPEPDDVDAVVFLLGDAGAAERERSPLLGVLRDDIERWSAALGRDSAASVIFLGDIVYPVGVREPDHPEFPIDSARLWSQIELVGGRAALEHATLGLFLTGNHDWGNTSGELGLERVQNLEAQLRAARDMGRYVALLPDAGEPGPVIRDLRNNVRILFIDIHWFLQERSAVEREAFFTRVQSALNDAGRREVIIVAHHPYYSAGPHGTMIPGYYSGGVAYLLKQSGTLVQDLNSPVYGNLLVRLRQIFRAANRPPLVFAGGHDHSLQVLEGSGDFDPRFSLVSGSGSKLSAVRSAPNLAWGGSRPGYMMLVFRRDDGVDLFVIAGERDHLTCDGSGAALGSCMAEAANAFDIVYSATLLDASREPVGIPQAERDTTPTSPWLPTPAPIPPNDEGVAADDTVPSGVPDRLLSLADDSVIAMPGRTYDAGRGRRLLFGDLHRDLWRVPVRLPVLKIDEVAGGLEPVELTGGKQTVGLELRGSDGMEYEFRPIVKDPRRVLPGWLQDGPIGDLIDDQMAAQFPYAAVVVHALLAAADITTPDLQPFVMPDDERLGRFRARFAGRVGLFGRRANERDDGRSGFADYTRIVETETLIEEVRTDPATRIDAEHYLRIRLIDMLVGDWDRHEGQWRWGRREQGDSTLWRAIPEDRDWAFPHVDGIGNRFTRLFLPRYVSFSSELPAIATLTEAAKPVDDLVLGGLDRAAFDEAARDVRTALTDSVIDAAVRRLPPPIFAAAGERLAADLKARRADLADYADAFYEELARTVHIAGVRGEEDVVEFERVDDDRIIVRSRSAGALRFERVLRTAETDEVRLYVNESEDVVRGGDDVPFDIVIVP